ncbi:MAG: DUF998 domain-containing protein [Candidatus Hadarchaeota archaeon]
MSSKKWPQIAGIFGILSPVVTISLVLLAIALSPWFSWSANALSDLGVGEAALIFNSGLAIGAVSTMLFSSGIFLSSKKRAVRRHGSIVLFAAAVSLLGVGIFTEAAGGAHFYFSVAFFFLLCFSLFILGAGHILAGSRMFGAFTISAGAMAAIPWAFSWTALAVPETISALAAGVWSILQGTRLYMGKV